LAGPIQHDGPGGHEPVHAVGEHVVQQGVLAVGVRGGVQGGAVGPVGLWVDGQRLADPGGQDHAVRDGHGGLSEGPVKGRQRFGLEAHGGRFGRVETVVEHRPQDRTESGRTRAVLLPLLLWLLLLFHGHRSGETENGQGYANG